MPGFLRDLWGSELSLHIMPYRLSLFPDTMLRRFITAMKTLLSHYLKEYSRYRLKGDKILKVTLCLPILSSEGNAHHHNPWRLVDSDKLW